jgi:hypothetical protein
VSERESGDSQVQIEGGVDPLDDFLPAHEEGSVHHSDV